MYKRQTFFRPQQYGEKYIIKEWPSFNAMLEGYYAEKDRAERLRTKSKELHKAVHNMYERAVRKQAARQEELAASGKSEKLRLYGELLSANLYLAQKGMKSITVPNWYDEGKEVTIPLDLRFTPSQNAQNFFKNYKKKQTAARMLVDLLAEGEKEIAYLETVLYEVESASGEAALNEIRAELKSQGYLKYYKQRDKDVYKRQHLPSPVVIFLTTSAKASVWVGKMAGVVALWPLASWVIMLLSMPMRSHRPLHSTFSPCISMS